MHTFTRLLTIVGLLLAMVIAIPARAQEAPDTLIRRVSQDILQTAAQDPAIRAGDRTRILQIVETAVLPHVDFDRTTRLALGRHARQATPQQRERIAEEFQTLLIRTYANALSKVRDQKFEFLPLRMEPGATEAEVNSRFLQPGRQPVQVSYRLGKAGAAWKIYDVNVMGIWLVETYRQNFSAIIERDGIDGLIASLADKNRKLAAGGERSTS